MRCFRLVLLAFLLPAVGPRTVAAQESNASNGGPGGTWTSTAALASQYLFRGARLGGPALQPSLDYNLDQVGAGLWANVPLDESVRGQSDPEVDFYAFYAWATSETFTVIPGFTVYTFPNADRRAGFHDLTVEPNLALNYSTQGFRITPKVFYDLTRRASTAEISVGFAIPLPAMGSELDLAGTAGTFIARNQAAGGISRVKSWGDYFTIGATLPFQFSATAKVTLGWTYSSGPNSYVKVGTTSKSHHPDATGRGVVTISYVKSF